VEATQTDQIHKDIVETIREPLLILDQDLRVILAGRSFYEFFKVTPEETVGQLVYDLGNKQWDIPKLRELLETILPQKTSFDSYEVEHDFTDIGRRIMLLNARQIKRVWGKERVILLAIEDITEHRQLELLLADSEKRFRRLFETANDGILLLEKHEGKITHSNPAIMTMLGYPKDELIGSKLYDVGFPNQLGTIQEIMQTLEKDGIIHYKDVPLQKKTQEVVGTDIYMVDKASLVQCNIRDITEQKLADKALRESEELLSRSQELAHIGSWKLDLIRNHLTWSDEVYRIFGCEPQEFAATYEAFLNFVHPDDRAAVDEAYSRSQQEGSDGYEIEHRIVRRNSDEIRYVHERCVHERNAAGTTIQSTGVVQDITERKQADLDVRSQKRLLEGVLDSINDIIGVQLPDHTMVQYNRAGYELLGLTEDQVRGKKCYELLGRATPCDICATSGSLISRTLERIEKFIPELGRHFLCTSNPVLDENGNIKLIIEQLSDITEKKKIDEMLHQAQKMESIGSLAGGIAHDFNNLLFPIVGLSEMMLNDFPPDSMDRHNIQEIFHAGKRGRELVQQILSFSRQSEHQLIPVHIQKILKEVLKLCRSTIPADITITRNIQTKCGPVMADPTQIHQIAMNLITNAFHAVEPAGGTITVQLKETDSIHQDDPSVHLASGRYAVLTVTDTGTGIDPAVMDRIFDPYFTTKEKGRGTGLGLATVYGIVKTHGGDIRVYSDIGKGATFHVYLPVLEKRQESEPEKEMIPLPTGTEHILLVDDENPIVQLEKQMLERLGYNTSCFTSSVDALAAFKTDPLRFDLVITDMNMPHMNGMQLAKELSAIKSDIPVIICTGFSERINKENAAAMGIKGLLMKPMVMKDLAQKVREVLDTMKE
jgi:PAS domain S-box-containing protein